MEDILRSSGIPLMQKLSDFKGDTDRSILSKYGASKGIIHSMYNTQSNAIRIGTDWRGQES